jgi:hypothetical protein
MVRGARCHATNDPTRIATLNVTTALALCKGTWRLQAGRLPWHSRRPRAAESTR